MLRTLIFAPVAVFALGAPAIASAEDFSRAASGAEVHADNGAVVGHVRSVTRDRGGHVTSMEIPGLAPPDASSVQGPMVAENDRDAREVPVVDMRGRSRVWVSQTSSREHARLR